MGAPFYYLVAERGRRLINPTTVEQVLKLGHLCRLDGDSRVLDMGCGKGEPAMLLATTYGCRVTGVDFEPTFLKEARERCHKMGVGDQCEFIESAGARYPITETSYDLAMCLGASFIYNGFEPTVKALAKGLKTDGYLAVGEPYWKDPNPPTEYLKREGIGPDQYATLAENLERLRDWGFELVSLLDASLAGWDSYEAHHWEAVDLWRRENPGHPKVKEVVKRMEMERETYLRWGREVLGWAIFVMRPLVEEGDSESVVRAA